MVRKFLFYFELTLLCAVPAVALGQMVWISLLASAHLLP
jgi:hypothetical protein